MPRLQVKSFHAPDERREIPRAHYENVQMGETVVAHATFDPGWRWSG